MSVELNKELILNQRPSRRIGFVFALLSTTNVLINIDHGIIPAATLQIKQSLSLSNAELGLLGSLVYAGIVTVALFGGKIFLLVRARYLILGSYIGMIVTLSLFTVHYPKKSKWLYFVFRYLTGVSQAPMLIYFPVWVDNFGQQSKTMWMTLLQGGVPIGIFSGYVISSIISNLLQWQDSFFFQILLLMVSFIVYLIFIQSNDIEVSEKIQHLKAEHNQQQASYWSMQRVLWTNTVWVCLAVGISILYFVVTGIQFWISNYMEVVLNQPVETVNSIFAVVSITAPILGCIYGGTITQMTGGYESEVAIKICLFNCGMACLVGAPIPFINIFWLVCVLIWALLFFGGALVPPLTGIMLSSVPNQMRPFANSNTTLLYNLIGFLPAPSVYGYLTQISPRAGIFFLMYYPFVGFFLLSVATFIRSRQSLYLKDSQRILIQNEGTTITMAKLDPKGGSKSRRNSFMSNVTENVFVYNQFPLTKSIASMNHEDILNLLTGNGPKQDNSSELPTDL